MSENQTPIDATHFGSFNPLPNHSEDHGTADAGTSGRSDQDSITPSLSSSAGSAETWDQATMVGGQAAEGFSHSRVEDKAIASSDSSKQQPTNPTGTSNPPSRSREHSSASGTSLSGSSKRPRSYVSVGTSTVAADNWRQRTRLLPTGIQRYQIRQEIGRGGCGVVSTAFDTQVQRLVVIKQILPESINNEAAARFLNEAQITGQLSHPGIVPVYEMGEDRDGMPFYVMKYLDGKTLSEEIFSLQTLPNSTQREEQLHRLLQRFIDVCQTLAFAHKHAVIHRDLKPANIMVGEFGETVVLDWGLARTCDEQASRRSSVEEATVGAQQNHVAEPSDDLPASFDSHGSASDWMTQAGAVLGTAAYMSPEQAQGAVDKLDQRTDVFSLGVILYELLSGKSPFRSDTLANTIENVRKCHYQPLRRVNRKLPRSLAAICHKAMAADPADRYLDAGHLAADLQRYQAGQPVHAYQERWFEKLDRLADRHRTIFRSVFATAIVVALTASVSTGIVTRAHLVEKQAHQVALSAKAETESALQQEQQAHQLANLQLTESRHAADNWLLQLSADLQFFPGLQSLRSNLFDQALNHYQQLIDQSSLAVAETDFGSREVEDWVLQTKIEIAKNQIRIGDILRLKGQPKEAAQAYGEALSGLQKLNEHLKVATSGQSASAISHEVTLQVANATLGLSVVADVATEENSTSIESVQTSLTQLLTDDPSNVDVRNALVRSRLLLSRLVSEGNIGVQRFDLAIAQLQQALADAEVLLQIDGSDRNRKLKENALRDLAQTYFQAEQFEEAAKGFDELLRFYDRLPQQYQSRPDIMEGKSWTRSFIAACEQKSGRTRQAIIQYEGALQQLDSAWNLLYDEAYYRENQAAIQFNQAQLLASIGRNDDALTAADSAMNQLRRAMQSTAVTNQRVERLIEIYLLLSQLLAETEDTEAANWLQQTQVLLQHLQNSGADAQRLQSLNWQAATVQLEQSVGAQNWQAATEQLKALSIPEMLQTGNHSLGLRVSIAEVTLLQSTGDLRPEALADFVQRHGTIQAIKEIDSANLSAKVIATAVGQPHLSSVDRTQLQRFSLALTNKYPESEDAWLGRTLICLEAGQWQQAGAALDRLKLYRIQPKPIHQRLERYLAKIENPAETDQALSESASNAQPTDWEAALDRIKSQRSE